jgi:monoterpene epsilon-lactone hydrolase
MQSVKSKLILGLLLHSHLLKLQLKRKPFDPSPEGIKRFREGTEKAAKMFGRLPKEAEIEPLVIGNRYAEWIKIPQTVKNKAILYFHGGMYLFGSPQAHRQHVIKFVKGCNMNALVIDYRLAPENPFPAALEDALQAYDYLLSQGYDPADIVFAGDSAGGGLCLATLLAIKDKGLPLPAATAALSPWTDLMLTGKSYQSNKKVCFSPGGCAENASRMYAGGHDKRNPLISPLYGNLAGLPPLHISAGGNEILLDDSIHFAEKARAAGVDVTLRIDKGMCHCYPVFGDLFRESKLALAEICQFLKFHTQKNMKHNASMVFNNT